MSLGVGNTTNTGVLALPKFSIHRSFQGDDGSLAQRISPSSAFFKSFHQIQARTCVCENAFHFVSEDFKILLRKF